MKNLIISLAVLLMATSCATVRTATSTNINVNTSVNQYPTIVDLDIDQNMVSREVSWTFVESLFQGMQIKKSYSTIVYDILKECKSDILLEQRVQTTKTPFGPTVIEISGYPAKFKNFRKPTKEEIEEISSFRTKRDVYVIGDSGQYKLE